MSTANTNLTSSTQIQTRFSYTETLLGSAGPASVPVSIIPSVNYRNGNTSGTCDTPYYTILNVAANTSVNTNFANGSVYDPLNNAISFARVKSITVKLVPAADTTNLGTNCTSITVLGMSGNVAQGGLLVAASAPRVWNGGGYTIFTPGNGVTSALYLNISNEDLANAASVQIILLGADS